ncbi:MAG: 4-(cytidine 5'-diphospho)-2-C-methyl-D-erythritol kinase [Legionellales bacterium]|nr:4-(cytidine 5'-diphospho)-2-C-methyl-D-erythritol kinase [Legionellales bacterium]
MIELKSPAKLNLFLHILGQRPDGYHLLESVFQLVNLCDDLHFEKRDSDEIIVESNVASLVNPQNLIYRAAALLKQRFHITGGIFIRLTKNIPIGGGMGGGSSNAATTLVALNQLWQLKLTHDELQKIGLELGADVPFFIFAQTAWVEGIGEKLTAFTTPHRYFVLAIPAVEISTQKIYRDPSLTRDSTACKIRALPKQGRNDMQQVVCQHFPAVAQALTWLTTHIPNAMLSGSGATVFAHTTDLDLATQVVKQAPATLKTVIVESLQISPIFDFAYGKKSL